MADAEVAKFYHACNVLLCDAELELWLHLARSPQPFFKIRKADAENRLCLLFETGPETFQTFPDKDRATVHEMVAWLEKMAVGTVTRASLRKLVRYSDPHMTFTTECAIPLWDRT
jgi:hypothetical protein